MKVHTWRDARLCLDCLAKFDWRCVNIEIDVVHFLQQFHFDLERHGEMDFLAIIISSSSEKTGTWFVPLYSEQ